MTDSSGVSTKEYSYDAFGVEEGIDDEDLNPFRYCGEYFDKETGRVYLRARYYVPSLGRFMTEDPINAGLNWYTYCNNNPLIFVDPWGLDAILINKRIDLIYNASKGHFAGPIDHMSAFFQDKDNNWYFFFWGEDVKYELITDTSIFDSMDKMNEYLYDKGLYAIEDVKYNSSVYIKGDFTESHTKAEEIKAAFKNQEWNRTTLLDFIPNLVNTNVLGIDNQDYRFFTNNCSQVTMELFFKGTLPDGTNVGDYVKSNMSGPLFWPNANMANMQTIFYNKALNVDGFNQSISEMQQIYGKNSFTQWVFSKQLSNINKIK